MYNNHFELVGDDLFVNFLMDQPQLQFQRVNSSSNIHCPPSDNEYPHEFLVPNQTPVPVKKQQKKKKSDDTMLASKNNLKNTYINKITSLIQEVKPAAAPRFERKVSTYTEDSAQAKLIRNRECARNSRKRKKIYIELLENRVNVLNEELEKCKRIIKGQTSYLQNMGSNQQVCVIHIQLQNFFLGRQQLFEKLEHAVQSNADNNEINLLLDSMRFRVGGGGKQRVDASNYFFQQILEVSFPIHVKYMLWACGEDHQEPLWFSELANDLNITDQQMKALKKAQKKMQNDKDKLDEQIKQFQIVKDNLSSRTQQIENVIDEMRTILSPTQVARLLIGLEKNKYQKEMSIHNLWKIFENEFETEIKEEDSFRETSPQKKVHI